jgi:hypothetical protein
MFKKPEFSMRKEKPQRKKSKIARLAGAPLGGRPVAMVCSTIIENPVQIGLIFAKQSQF